MRRIVLASIVVVGLVVRSAYADQPRKKPVAQLLSGVGAAAPALLVLGGFMFAPTGQNFEKPLLYTGLATGALLPSAGEWYAASSPNDWVTYGMAARVLGAGLATLALTTQMKTQTCDNATTAAQMCTTLQGAGYAMMGIAAIAFIGGMAYDVTDAADAVDRWNTRHGFSATIVPTALATPTGTISGIALAGAF